MKRLTEGYHLAHVSALGDRLNLIFQGDDARRSSTYLDLSEEELRQVLLEVAKNAPHMLYQALEERLLARFRDLLYEMRTDDAP